MPPVSTIPSAPAGPPSLESSGKTRTHGGRGGRKTIAVLTDHMDLFAGGGYESELRDTFERTSRALDVNLLLVFGRALQEPHPWQAAHNAVFDLMQPGSVDGLVTVSGALATFCGPEGLQRFLERYRPMATASLGMAVPGVPSIAVDDRAGIQAAVEHMVRDHGCRRLAFIGGPADNPDAKTRYAVYREVLARYGIPFDPELVKAGDFTRRSGHVAMATMLEQGGQPDAVIAANDGMALGAIAALQERGLRVPRDVLVTGFDDVLMARLGDPPLTTVRQPLSVMADSAIRLVLDQLERRPVPDLTVLAAPLVLRESCGCGGATSPGSVGNPEPADRVEATGGNATLAPRPAETGLQEDRARILTAMRAEAAGHSDSLLGAVRDILAEVGHDNERYQTLQAAITQARAELRRHLPLEFEDLWHAARSLVALSNTRAQMQLRLEQDETYHRLIGHGEEISVALDLPSLRQALSLRLPQVGIQNAFISRYTDPTSHEVEPFVCLVGGRPYESAVARFPDTRLIPPGTPMTDERRTFLVFPLSFEAQRLGIAVFEYLPQTKGHLVLRDQISAALRSVALHQEVIEKTTLHERSIQEQERTATAKRIQSLSVLAGGVAHDLNNALGPLVALPDVILEELGRPSSSPTSANSDLRADVEDIKFAALRAAQTIKDLLTLSRQGHTAKEALDLGQIVVGCLAEARLRSVKHTNRNVEMELELHPDPLYIHASEAHVARAVTNLLRNALEAIEGDGTVVVKTQRAAVTEPIWGYEAVEPGDYAVLSVTDTGKGIPESDIGRVFEPFFTKKRVDDESGSGLGLAIVHGVVKEHGGFVNVQSAVDRGTAFTLYFPRCAPETKPHRNISVAPRGRARILVVDDESVQLRTARRVLSHLGYEVDTLQSGKQAYQRFAAAEAALAARATPSADWQSPYDLVILDMILNEEHDGLQLFQRIQRLFPEQRAIIASGHAPNERAQLATEKGLIWLVKPYTTDALARAVKSAILDEPKDSMANADCVEPAVPTPPGRTGTGP